MASLTKRGSDGKVKKAPAKLRRFVNVRHGLLVMTLDDGKHAVADAYEMREVGSNVGRAFSLRKVLEDSKPLATPRTHLTEIGGEGYGHCDCDGFKFNGHCRHVEALSALVQCGRLGNIPG